MGSPVTGVQTPVSYHEEGRGWSVAQGSPLSSSAEAMPDALNGGSLARLPSDPL